MDMNFGIQLALAAHGMTPAEFEYVRSFVDHVSDSKDAGALHKQAAALGASFYKAAGREDALGYHLYNNLAQPELPWSPGYEPLVMPVYRALEGNNPFRKEAMSGALSGMWQTLKQTPGLWQKLLLASGVAGAGAGALTWQLGQEQPEEDAEAASMLSQIDYLNRVTNDIDDELQQRGIRA